MSDRRQMRAVVITMILTAVYFLPALAANQATESEHATRHDEFSATSHRRFDDVEYWTGIFDDPKRDEWQKPDALVEALQLKAGDHVADLGAGTGYLLSRLSRAVTPIGRVYAVEVEPTLLAHMRERAERDALDNVTLVLASAANPRLPAHAVDLLLILDTYHHLDARDRYLDLVRDVLADGGRIAIVDWKKQELPMGPPMDHKLARDRVVQEMESAGFRLTEEPQVLEYQYFLIFEEAR